MLNAPPSLYACRVGCRLHARRRVAAACQNRPRAVVRCAAVRCPAHLALYSCVILQLRALNTLAGKQTLGQEYCGVDLTAPGGGGGGPPILSKTPLRAYTFLRVAVPYLQVGSSVCVVVVRLK